MLPLEAVSHSPGFSNWLPKLPDTELTLAAVPQGPDSLRLGPRGSTTSELSLLQSPVTSLRLETLHFSALPTDDSVPGAGEQFSSDAAARSSTAEGHELNPWFTRV